MNIHPIFVHFPIALLTVYAIAELIRFKKVTETPYYFYVKAVLVIAGTLSSSLALQTGELAEHLLGERGSKLIDSHATFATISTDIFAILAVVYLLIWISKTSWNTKINEFKNGIFAKIWNLLVSTANKIISSPLSFILAFIGLIAVTVTGALGGAIVYGPTVDPIVSFIYNLVM